MIQFGKTFLLDETEDVYKVLTTQQINKAHNIIQIQLKTGDMNFRKVKNRAAVSGVLVGAYEHYRNREKLNRILKIINEE